MARGDNTWQRKNKHQKQLQACLANAKRLLLSEAFGSQGQSQHNKYAEERVRWALLKPHRSKARAVVTQCPGHEGTANSPPRYSSVECFDAAARAVEKQAALERQSDASAPGSRSGLKDPLE